MKIDPNLTGLTPKGDPEYGELVDFLNEKSTSNILVVLLHSNGMVEKGKETLKKLMDDFLKSGYVKEALRFDTPEIFIKYGAFTDRSNGVSDLSEFLKGDFFKKKPTDFSFWRDMGVTFGKFTSYIEDYVKRKGFNEYVLVSKDGMAMVMNFALKADVVNVEEVVEAVSNLKRIASRIEKESGFEIEFTGAPMATYESHKAIREDFVITTIFSLASISLLLYLTLGNIFNVFALFFSMIIAMAISIGVYYFAFGKINIVTSFINAMVLGLGIDFGIHVITRYTHHLKREEESERALELAVKETFLPSLFSALTTVSAFLTMVFSRSEAFSQMGLMSAMGIGVFFVVMYVFLVALVFSKKEKIHEFKLYDFIIRTMDHTRKNLGVFAFFLTASIVFSYFGYLNFRNYWYTPPGLIPSSSEYYRAYKFLEKEFPGYGTGDIVLATTDFEKLEALTNSLKEDPNFSSVLSLTTLFEGLTERSAMKISRYYGALSDVIKNPVLTTFLRKVGMYHQILEMLKVIQEAKDLQSIIGELRKDLPMFFFDHNGKEYYLVYVKSVKDPYVDNNLKRIFEYLEKEYRGYTFFGYPALLYKLMGDIKGALDEVTIFIGISITIILIVSTRSFSNTFRMLLVLALSITSTLGIVYFFDIRVSFMTLLVVPIMIGIGVDGMIHLAHNAGRSREVIVRTEKAISISVLTTVLAFGSLSFARGRLLREFGISVAAGLLVSFLLTVFVFLPMIDRRDGS